MYITILSMSARLRYDHEPEEFFEIGMISKFYRDTFSPTSTVVEMVRFQPDIVIGIGGQKYTPHCHSLDRVPIIGSV